MMNKKLKKLLTNPRLFLKDMLIKRGLRRAPMRAKLASAVDFSVVVAVYNVEKYLEEFVGSLVHQSIDFGRHVQLILVDDGSTDGSAAIARSWAERYPMNIEVLHKDNGGQASARNLGLQNVRNPWVTFMDPDDFVDARYLESVARMLNANKAKSMRMVGCNLLFYFESTRHVKDTHPLKYKFQKGDVVLPINDWGKHIHMSAATAFFYRDVLASHSIRFDERIRPAFEDAHFISTYLAAVDGGHVGFCANAKYFYRKREDGTSTLDTAWQHPGRFGAMFSVGHLGSMSAHRAAKGNVPLHVQRMSLYDIIWFLRRLQDQPVHHGHLSEDSRKESLSLLREVFSYIDVETIMTFELAGCWFLHKVGMLGAYKDAEPTFQIAYVDDMDPIKGLLLVKFFSRGGQTDLRFEVGGLDLIPDHAKTVQHTVLGETFVFEHRLWVPVPDVPDALRCWIGGRPARLTLGTEQYRDGLSAARCYRHFRGKTHFRLHSATFSDAWLLMDRVDRADDNAEHLYRYLRDVRPHLNTWFVLDRGSPDWERLSDDGFRMIEFGSAQHEQALRSASKLLCSHADAQAVDRLGTKLRRPHHFVFLQHGVILNDLSSWLNTKKIDCFVTASKDEYTSIAGPHGAYVFTDKEVVLTGLPRHDALMAPDVQTGERLLLVMPTWRKGLLGSGPGANSARGLSTDFLASAFVTHWMALLASPHLKALADLHGLKIVFIPHPNLEPCLPHLTIPAHVEVRRSAAGSLQADFKAADLLITDYSSVAFEIAQLGRPVVYYQFDEDDFFGGAHTLARGYFDFRRDGFGPVEDSLDGVVASVARLLETPDQTAADARRRADACFAFRDRGNCERVVRAVEALDAPRDEHHVNTDILRDLAHRSLAAEDWKTAARRFERLCTDVPHPPAEEVSAWLQALERWPVAHNDAASVADLRLRLERCLPFAVIHGLAGCGALELRLADLAASGGDWSPLVAYWSARQESDPAGPYRLAAALQRQNDLASALAVLEGPRVRPPETAEEHRLRIELLAHARRWTEAADQCAQAMVLHGRALANGLAERGWAFERLARIAEQERRATQMPTASALPDDARPVVPAGAEQAPADAVLHEA